MQLMIYLKYATYGKLAHFPFSLTKPEIRCQLSLLNLYTEAEGNALSELSPSFNNYRFYTSVTHYKCQHLHIK